MENIDVWHHLRRHSSTPDLYWAWAGINLALFDDELRVIPVIVGLSRYGAKLATCEMDCITMQPSVYERGAWYGLMVHEMAHQADHQAGLSYRAVGRTENIHNSEAWCNRINGLMDRMGDHRWATPYRRRGDGTYAPINPTPDGRELIPYEGVARWEPTPACLGALGLAGLILKDSGEVGEYSRQGVAVPS